MKRRDLLKAGMIGGGLGLTGLLPTACSTISERREPAASGEAPYLIRYEVNSKEAQPHLITYAAAVAKMKAQPTTVLVSGKKVPNGLNWSQQAAVHLNHCPHGSWNFFSWHRDYLKRFENIIRNLSGNNSFVLPYWDWTANPSLPAAFRDKNSSLYMNEPSRLQDLTPQIAEQTNLGVMKQLMVITDFESFMGSEKAAGQVEYGPHNGVHATFGGTMGQFTSPLDPIFWLHHANVDRIWAMWQDGNGKAWKDQDNIASNAASQAWLNLSMEGFYDFQGKPVVEKRTAKDMLDVVSLSYIYDTQSASHGEYRAANSGRMPAANAVKKRMVERAFNRDPLKTTFIEKDSSHSQFEIDFPNVAGNVGKQLDAYMHDPTAKASFEYRLKVIGFPKLSEPTSMKISYLNGTQEVYLTTYNFFVPSRQDRDFLASLNKEADLTPTPTAGQHEHDGMWIPDFNIDYKVLLNKLYASGARSYPGRTQFLVQFTNPMDRSPRSVQGLDFSHLGFKFVVLENTAT